MGNPGAAWVAITGTIIRMHTVNRLHHEFKPEHYNISLVIDQPKRMFKGTTTIEGIVTHNKIVTHAKNLTFESVTIDGKAAEWVQGQDDEITMTLPNLTPGKHIVTIAYQGQINNQLHGLYVSTYQHGGLTKEMLVTQLESHYAREVFPCVDEPAAKATYDVTISTQGSSTVLGNMPIKHQSSEGGRLITTFETTPLMSTYLLAFVVGELQSISKQTNSGVTVSVWSTPAQPTQGLNFALEHAVNSIEFFERYFGVPYPLPKSDQVALPDFSAGAMENWGLVTYRESALLYIPGVTSIASKQYIATVISHELSHQWFGNLVTMKWWDDLWLNESFATIMEYVCVDAVFPDWNIWTDFNIQESSLALRRDSLDGVQPVKLPVNHPDELTSVFDAAIVYAKGARLMRMMQVYVGEDAFRSGLKHYFEAHAYGNTSGSDLWEALENSSGKKVGDFMNTWLTESGFPMVSLSVSGDSVIMTQNRFFIGPHGESKKVWPIPLGSNNNSFPAILTTKRASVPYVKSDNALRLNTQDSAHFITLYSPELFSQILDEIKHNQADTVTRVQIIKERLPLAKSDAVSASSLVDLLQAYAKETDQKVWELLSGTLGDLKRFVDPDTPAEAALKTLATSTARPLFRKLGWTQQPGESEEDSLLRATVIGMMLYGEDKSAIAQARQLYRTQKLDHMDAELRDLILATEVRHGDTVKAIDSLLDIYRSTASVDIRHDICDGVTATRDSAQIERLLNLIQDTSLIRTQDTVLWFVRLLNNRFAREKAWQWLMDNWPWLQQTFSGDKSYDSFVRYSAQILSTRKQLDQFVAFFEHMKTDAALALAIKIGINDITARVTLIESDKKAVEQRLLEL